MHLAGHLVAHDVDDSSENRLVVVTGNDDRTDRDDRRIDGLVEEGPDLASLVDPGPDMTLYRLSSHRLSSKWVTSWCPMRWLASVGAPR